MSNSFSRVPEVLLFEFKYSPVFLSNCDDLDGAAYEPPFSMSLMRLVNSNSVNRVRIFSKLKPVN